MLKLTLPLSGRLATVELDGVDVSRFFHAVAVETNVGGLTKAVLQYRGAVVVELPDGRIELQQAPLYVTCDACHATLSGLPARPAHIREQP